MYINLRGVFFAREVSIFICADPQILTSLACRLDPAADCPYLHDTWVTNTYEYVPFESLLSRGKHATQSSTLGTGLVH